MHEHHDDHADHDHDDHHLGKSLAWVVRLLTVFVLFELIVGFLLDGEVVVADAIHNLSDIVGMGLFWSALRVREISASRMRAMAWVLLFVGFGLLLPSALHDLHSSKEPSAPLLLLMTTCMSLGVNSFGLQRLHAHRHHQKGFGAWFHLAVDVFASFVAVVMMVLVTLGHPAADAVGTILVIAVVALVAPIAGFFIQRRRAGK